MKDCVIKALNGDMWINGESMTPDEWVQVRARADHAERIARLQRTRISEMAERAGLIEPRFASTEHAGEKLAHDSLRDQRNDC